MKIETVHGTLPISREEASEIVRRLRSLDAGGAPGDAIAASIHLEHALENSTSPANVPLNRPEMLAVSDIIRSWVNDVGAKNVSERIMRLRSALQAELSDQQTT